MEPKELVTNKFLVWVSPLSFISKWLLKERNGTFWSFVTKRLGYKQITCVGISFISKWLLTEQNGSELNGTERKAMDPNIDIRFLCIQKTYLHVRLKSLISQ